MLFRELDLREAEIRKRDCRGGRARGDPGACQHFPLPGGRAPGGVPAFSWKAAGVARGRASIFLEGRRRGAWPGGRASICNWTDGWRR
jgi:hypothetical protein